MLWNSHAPSVVSVFVFGLVWRHCHDINVPGKSWFSVVEEVKKIDAEIPF